MLVIVSFLIYALLPSVFNLMYNIRLCSQAGIVVVSAHTTLASASGRVWSWQATENNILTKGTLITF